MGNCCHKEKIEPHRDIEGELQETRPTEEDEKMRREIDKEYEQMEKTEFNWDKHTGIAKPEIEYGHERSVLNKKKPILDKPMPLNSREITQNLNPI